VKGTQHSLLLTSGTLVSYGVLTNSGGLSFTSLTRTIIGMFRLRRVDTTVHDIYRETEKVEGLCKWSSYAYLKDDVTQIVLIAIERLQQHQCLAAQRKDRLSLDEVQL
jgi:hypothetical protein